MDKEKMLARLAADDARAAELAAMDPETRRAAIIASNRRRMEESIARVANRRADRIIPEMAPNTTSQDDTHRGAFGDKSQWD